MKTKLTKLVATLLILGSGAAMAGPPLVGPGFDVGTFTNPNDTARGGSALLVVDFYSRGDVFNTSFVMPYDPLVFDEDNIVVDCTAGIPGLVFVQCSVNTAANEIRGIGFPAAPAVLGDSIGFANITLPVLPGAAFGASTLDMQATFFGSDTLSLGVDNSLDGTVTVVGPRYAADLAAGGTLSMGAQISQAASADLVISNIGAAGTTLTGSCAKLTDVDNKFTVGGDTPFAVGDSPDTDTVTVTCDSSVARLGNPFTGTMECGHDGDNTGPDISIITYNLSCEISPGPQPRYTGTPVNTAMVAVEQGDASPTGSLTIDNTAGDGVSAGNPVGSVLTGNCSYSGDGEITVANQGGFSLAQLGGPTHVVTWSCDTTVGDQSPGGILTCSHNGIGTTAGDQIYNLTCDVGPPGDAGYSPAPADNTTINMTPAGDVIAGSTPAPTADLVITNVPPGPTPNNDSALILSECLFSGATEITATQPTSSTLAPFESATVTFTCDTASATGSPFTGLYSCNYDIDGGAADFSTTHNVSCGVREPESDVDESPDPTDPLTILVPQGGTNTVSVFLIETIGEGADDASFDCSLGDETFFTITSASSGDIDSAETITIIVEGRDPRPDEISASTTLTCNWVDSTGDGNSATWLIDIRVPAEDIPTMSDWGRMLLILSLLAVGGFVVRRRMTA